MVPKLMLDGMPYDLSEITANTLDGDTSWNGKNSAKVLLDKLMNLVQENKGPADNGYWISFVEIMVDGVWFVPTIQYAFHVFPSDSLNSMLIAAHGVTPTVDYKIHDILKIKDIYARNTQGDNKWKLVHRSHGNPIPKEDMARRGATGTYKSRLSEESHIWDPVDMGTLRMEPKSRFNYVVSNWIDISSFAFRELINRDIDPDEGELKMLIQVAAKTNIFQAAINKEAI